MKVNYRLLKSEQTKEIKNMKKQFKSFIGSFKNKDYLRMFLYESLFYIIVLPSFLLVSLYLKHAADKLNPGALQNSITLQSIEAAEPIFRQFQFYFYMFMAFAVLLFLITLFSWSLSRGLAYTHLLGRKMTKIYFLKFSGLSLIFGIIIFAVALFFGSIVNISKELAYTFFIFIIAALYFIPMIYMSFTKDNKIFSSIGEGLAFGAKKIHKLIIPCIFISIVFILAIIINTLQAIVTSSLASYISGILFIAFIAWARLYLVEEAKKLM